jgi:ribonucleoside-diphosphate reductase alpha chain
MRIDRHFTTTGKDPYEGIDFVRRSSRIVKANGESAREIEGVVAPEAWSQTAVDILAQKYFRRRGAKADGGGETDAREVFHRLAGCWTDWGRKHGYFDTDADSEAFCDELKNMLARQVCAPNSPQWFNTGLNFAYGLTGPAQGHFYADPATGEIRESENAYGRPQPHACFIQPVKDDLVGPGGIMDLWVREARLFKYGSGTGTNFSTLRGESEGLSGGGASSGLLSFLAIGDRAAGAIKSGGTTRRAAKMCILDADHPDIEAFVDLKVKQERKVAMVAAGSLLLAKHWDAMCKAVETAPDRAPLAKDNPALQEAVAAAKRDGLASGFILQCLGRLKGGDLDRDLQAYDTAWEGEAYAEATGMNANNSVRVTDGFMRAVDADSEWALIRRTDRKVHKTLRAKGLWRRISKASWACADPGIQFDTTINEWHTCPESGRINGSNPCSEFMFLDDSACNLASFNLCAFLLPDGGFDVVSFRHAARLWTLVLDISILMAQYPSAAIADTSHRFRPLGLGYANLGSLFMRLGIAYDSDAGRQWCAAITALLTGEAYAASAEMAGALGPFAGYADNAKAMLRVIRNHRRAAQGTRDGYEGLSVFPAPLTGEGVPKPLLEAAREAWDRALKLGKAHGYRNAQTTLLAPTGTIGLVMDCDTTGIEPDFALVKFKKLAGGGYLKQVNGAIPSALRGLGYAEAEIADIADYIVGVAKIDERTPGIRRSDLIAAGLTNHEIETLELGAAAAFDAGEPVRQADLAKRGFSPERIQTLVDALNGAMAIEGAPHLKDEHLSVFDCANRCGRIGQRFIAPMGHLKMMAAAQPFLSGAISKTVNLPAEVTVTDIEDLHWQAWRMAIKSVAIYRDGSKMSQAVATSMGLLEGITEGPTADRVMALAMAAIKRGQRKRMPDRRGGYTQGATVGGTKLYVRTGEYDDGSLGEIFLDLHKEGAGLRAVLNCFAIAVSMCLQYGVPLDVLCEQFMFQKFEPAGMVTGNSHIKTAQSLIDYIFRELAITYLGRHDLINAVDQVAPSRPGSLAPFNAAGEGGNINPTHAAPKPVMEPPAAKNEALAAFGASRQRGYTGDPCPECGHLTLVRNGACLKCQTCGATTGCS